MARITNDTSGEIYSRMAAHLRSQTKISRLSPGSKARVLLETISAEMGAVYTSVHSSLLLGYVQSASGEFLDALGEVTGTYRRRATASSTDALSRTVRIATNPTDSFGNINSGQDVVIPSNTIIRSSTSGASFYTTATTVLNQNATEGFLSVASTAPGAASSAAVGELNIIDFTGFDSYPNSLLSVGNVSAIDNGSDEESDQFYRYRIINAFQDAQKANAIAVRLAALSVFGVEDVVLLPLYEGVGTAHVVLDTTDGVVSPGTRAAVLQRIEDVKAISAKITVRAPERIGVSLDLSLTYRRGTTERNKSDAQASIRSALSSMVITTRLGGTLRLNDIAERAKSSHTSIAQVGLPNTPLDRVLVWRDSIQFGRASLLLENENIRLREDERLFLEGDANTAISVTEV